VPSRRSAQDPGGWSALVAGASAAHSSQCCTFVVRRADLHVSAGILGGCLSNHGKSWHRSADGPAPAGGEKSARVEMACWRARVVSFSSLCFYSSARAFSFITTRWASHLSRNGPAFSRIYRAADACRYRRDDDRGDSRRGHVQSERGSQFARVCFGGRFYLPRIRIFRAGAHALSRLMTVVWAAILFALAMFSRSGGHVVEIGLSIARCCGARCSGSSCWAR